MDFTALDSALASLTKGVTTLKEKASANDTAQKAKADAITTANQTEADQVAAVGDLKALGAAFDEAAAAAENQLEPPAPASPPDVPPASGD